MSDPNSSKYHTGARCGGDGDSDVGRDEASIAIKDVMTAPYDFFVALKFQATCWADEGLGEDMKNQEIIEFSSVVVSLKTLEIVERFERFARPTKNPILCDFCKHRTKITQEQVDVADVLAETFTRHQQMVSKYPNSVLVTCGDGDLKTTLPKEMSNKLLGLIPDYYTRWINLEHVFSQVTLVKITDGMEGMLRQFGLELDVEGIHHRGIDDCVNIARVAIAMVKQKGWVPRATWDPSHMIEESWVYLVVVQIGAASGEEEILLEKGSSSRVDLPKGRIGVGENAEVAAERVLRKKSGYTGRMLQVSEFACESFVDNRDGLGLKKETKFYFFSRLIDDTNDVDDDVAIVPLLEETITIPEVFNEVEIEELRAEIKMINDDIAERVKNYEAENPHAEKAEIYKHFKSSMDALHVLKSREKQAFGNKKKRGKIENGKVEKKVCSRELPKGSVWVTMDGLDALANDDKIKVKSKEAVSNALYKHGGSMFSSETSAVRFIAVIDFEATCWDKHDKLLRMKQRLETEIIEFPTVLYSIGEDGGLKLVGEFQRFVKPTKNPILSLSCTELTSITQEQVDGADTIDRVIKEHAAWLAEMSGGASANEIIFVADGDADFKTFLPLSLSFHSLDVPPLYYRWCNIRLEFLAAFDSDDVWMTYRKMMGILGLEQEGHHHSGIDDCRNIGRILVAIWNQGHRSFKTQSLKRCEPDGGSIPKTGGGRRGRSKGDGVPDDVLYAMEIHLGVP